MHNIKVSYILFNMCDIISLSKIKATTIDPVLEACNKKLPLHTMRVTQHGMLSFYLHHFLAEYVIPYLLLYIPVD